MTGESEPDQILNVMLSWYPDAKVVLTLGKSGVVYRDKEHKYMHGTYLVDVVDTTAAGDTFTGYFLEAYLNGSAVPEALRVASIASSIAVSRKGASDSIPYCKEVMESRLELVQE
ncbi:carbohydrate kinase family protein [Caproiciproducens faecalis]|uniref:carbohydrate kinase family protein n=1 Tax=Caproiciproducens faecalis TaxID=2820301 RepID=UPI002ED6A13F